MKGMEEFALRFTQAAAHFLWIGVVLALVVFLVDRLLIRSSAVRHGWYLLGILSMLAIFPFSFFVLGTGESSQREASDEGPALDAVQQEVVAPTFRASHQEAKEPSNAPVVDSASVADESIAPPVASENIVADKADFWETISPWVIWIYLAGISVMILRLVFGWWKATRLRVQSSPMDKTAWSASLERMRKAIGVKVSPLLRWSSDVSSPIVIGLIKPLILLPVSLASRLSPEQVEAVLAHELAHLKRRDTWAVVVQRIVESVLFFHPAIWWMSRQLEKAREEACDDLVVAAGCDPADYAEALVICSEVRLENAGLAPDFATQLAATGNGQKPLHQRVLRLLGQDQQTSLKLGSLGCVMGLLALSSIVFMAVAGDATGQDTEGAEEASSPSWEFLPEKEYTLHDLESGTKNGALNLRLKAMETMTEAEWATANDPFLVIEFVGGKVGFAVAKAEEFSLVEINDEWEKPQRVLELLKQNRVQQAHIEGHQSFVEEGAIFHAFDQLKKGRRFAFAVGMEQGVSAAGIFEIQDVDAQAETLTIDCRFLPKAATQDLFAIEGEKNANVRIHDLSIYKDGGTLGVRFQVDGGKTEMASIDSRLRNPRDTSHVARTPLRVYADAMYPTDEGARLLDMNSKEENRILKALKQWVDSHYTKQQLEEIARKEFNQTSRKERYALNISYRLKALLQFRIKGEVTIYQVTAFKDGGTIGVEYQIAGGEIKKVAIDGRNDAEGEGTPSRLYTSAMHPTHQGARLLEDNSKEEKRALKALQRWLDARFTEKELEEIQRKLKDKTLRYKDLSFEEKYARTIYSKLRQITESRIDKNIAAAKRNAMLLKAIKELHARGFESGVDIPEKIWPKEIKEMRPKRLYSDRVNLVVALDSKAGVESGFYVMSSISSFFPTPGRDQERGFEFEEGNGDIYPYRRDLKAVGVQVEIRPQLVGSLSVEVKNDGTNDWLVYRSGFFGKLEVNGVTYEYHGRKQAKSSPLSPGRNYGGFGVNLLNDDWKNAEGKSLDWNQPKTKVRYAPSIQLNDGKHQDRVIWSNYVTLEVAKNKEAKGLEFLKEIPEFQDFTLKITEAELQKAIDDRGIYSIETKENKYNGYWLLTQKGENLMISFNEHGECGGIQRLQPIPRDEIKKQIGEIAYKKWQEKLKKLNPPFDTRKRKATVTGPDGKMLAGVEVKAFTRDGLRKEQMVLRTKTDAEGYFMLPDGPTGQAPFRGAKPGYRLEFSKPGYRQWLDRVFVERDAEGHYSRHNFLLRKTTSLSGTVLGVDRKPLRHAQIRLKTKFSDPDQSSNRDEPFAQTAEDGSFQFEGILPGKHFLHFYGVFFDGAILPPCTAVAVAETSDFQEDTLSVKGIVLDLSQTASLELTLVDQEGKPLPNAELSLQWKNSIGIDLHHSQYPVGLSDESGKIILPGIPPGEWSFRVEWDGLETRRAEIWGTQVFKKGEKIIREIKEPNFPDNLHPLTR